MNKTTNISQGESGVMLVVSPTDLKNVIGEMYREHKRDKEQAASDSRMIPTMTRNEVAAALRVSMSTLWRWAKSGYLMPVKIGSKVLYRAADIDGILQNNEGARYGSL